jgi:mevalonate kinase
MVTCSAPGKVYLFGEHAVVYGINAICCAVDIRTRVTVDARPDILIESSLGTTGLDYSVHPYVSAVLEAVRDVSPFAGIKVHIESDLPVGSGLGSSAAVTVATLKALDAFFGLGFSPEDIASRAHAIETQIQGAASPSDTYVCTTGGTVMIPDRRRISSPEYAIVIGNTGIFASTKELVAGVAALKNVYPDVISPVFSAIGNAALRGETLLAEKDYEALGRLMDINQGLLDALGVGCPELSGLIYAARAAGACGAKITGAGGGGCMFALVRPDRAVAVGEAIARAGGVPFITTSTEEGARLVNNG